MVTEHWSPNYLPVHPFSSFYFSEKYQITSFPRFQNFILFIRIDWKDTSYHYYSFAIASSMNEPVIPTPRNIMPLVLEE